MAHTWTELFTTHQAEKLTIVKRGLKKENFNYMASSDFV